MVAGCSIRRIGASTALTSSEGAESVLAKKSLRKCINAHCRGCCYDDKAAGTWLAQVTLCSVRRCELYDVRPTTASIPDSVFDYYGVTDAEKDRLTLKSTPEGGFSEQTGFVESREEGAA